MNGPLMNVPPYGTTGAGQQPAWLNLRGSQQESQWVTPMLLPDTESANMRTTAVMQGDATGAGMSPGIVDARSQQTPVGGSGESLVSQGQEGMSFGQGAAAVAPQIAQGVSKMFGPMEQGKRQAELAKLQSEVANMQNMPVNPLGKAPSKMDYTVESEIIGKPSASATLQAGAAGAQLGGQIGGGWGALIGGVVGTLGGLFGSMGGGRRKAREANEAAEAAALAAYEKDLAEWNAKRDAIKAARSAQKYRQETADIQRQRAEEFSTQLQSSSRGQQGIMGVSRRASSVPTMGSSVRNVRPVMM